MVTDALNGFVYSEAVFIIHPRAGGIKEKDVPDGARVYPVS